MDPEPGSTAYILADFSEYFSTYGFHLLVILLLMLFSGMMSGSEVAYFSLSKAEIEEFKKKNGRVWKLLKQPRILLATILIFNNLVNVGIIILSTFLLSNFGEMMGWVAGTWQANLQVFLEIVVITFVLLFFGEITPKIYSTQKRVFLAEFFSGPMHFLRTIFAPLSWLLIKSTSFIDRRIPKEREAASVEEIKHAIDLTSEEESPEEEKDILKGIVNFSNTQVRRIMRSRVDVRAIEIGTKFEEVILEINEFGYSRIPVYKDSLDNVKGILYIKDMLPLLAQPETPTKWEKLIRPPYFVPETKKIQDLLEEFKEKRLHIAIVVDEFGGTAGIVTLEDIIEEIFGEINDEFDGDELVYSKLSKTEFIFDGRISLNDLSKITELNEIVLEDMRGESDSLAGLILEIHGKIPERGELIENYPLRFHIESVGNNRIRRVKLVILKHSPEISSKNS